MALEHFECNNTSLKYIDCLMTLHIRNKLIVSQSEHVLHGPILLQTTLLVILVKFIFTEFRNSREQIWNHFTSIQCVKLNIVFGRSIFKP